MSSRSRTNGADNRPTPPNIETMHSLKVDNLTFRTRAEDLRKYFEKFGAIGDIYIPRDQFSRSSRGYAFVRLVSIIIVVINGHHVFISVRFLKKRDAEDALDRMDGAEIDGREVRVQFARYGRASNIDGRDRSRRHR